MESSYFYKDCNFEQLLNAFSEKYNEMSPSLLRNECFMYKLEKYSKLNKPDLIRLLTDDFINKIKIFVNYNIFSLKQICESLSIDISDAHSKTDIINCIMNCVDYTKCTLEDCKAFSKDPISVPIAVPITVPISVPISFSSFACKNNDKERKEEKEVVVEEVKDKVVVKDKDKEKVVVKEKDKVLVKDKEKEKVVVKVKENDKEKEKEKGKKKPIPKAVRKIIWDTYVGPDIIKHRCLCCKRAMIDNMSFDCGHVVSEKDGGTQEITNLRPICPACNNSMGSQNMIEYIKTYGFYI
jgi:hypothetical protein